MTKGRHFSFLFFSNQVHHQAMAPRTKDQRSEAAKKGIETRRRNAEAAAAAAAGAAGVTPGSAPMTVPSPDSAPAIPPSAPAPTAHGSGPEATLPANTTNASRLTPAPPTPEVAAGPPRPPVGIPTSSAAPSSAAPASRDTATHSQMKAHLEAKLISSRKETEAILESLASLDAHAPFPSSTNTVKRRTE